MEKLGQLRRRRPAHRQLGPDRGRHPAVALGAGLPRRPRAALELPRRPVHPAAAGPGPGPGQADERRPRRDHQRADQDPGRAGAAGHADVRGRLRHAVRRVPAARAEDLRSCSRPTVRRSWWSRRPEPDALREAAYFVERLNEERMPLAGLVVNRASRTPGRTGCRSSARWPRRSASRRTAPTGPTAGLLRLHADRSRIVARESRAARAVRARLTRTCRRPSCRHCPPTCTTSTAFGWSAIFSPRGRDRGRVDDPSPSGCERQAGTSSGDGADTAADVVEHRRLEQATPRGDVRATTQQRTALALGHATPDAPLDLVVERLGEALGAHRAAGAHLLGAVLRRASHEQLIRSRLVAQCLDGPVFVPHRPSSLPRRAHLPAGRPSQSPRKR